MCSVMDGAGWEVAHGDPENQLNYEERMTVRIPPS